MNTNYTNYDLEQCLYKHQLRIEYNRKNKKVYFKPCCLLYPKYEIPPFAWKADYYLSHINECIDTYTNFNLSNLSKYYNGVCTCYTYNPILKQPCKNYIGNRKLETIENSIFNGCNLKCIMCGQGGNCKEPLEEKLYLETFNKLNSNYKIVTTGRGEPLIYKKELFELITNKKFKRVDTITNGTLFTNDDISLLSNYKDYISIIMSFDSDIKEIYEKIRIGANFDIVYNNLIKLHEAGVLNRIHLVVQKLNKDTCIDTSNRLKKIGIYTKFIIRDGDIKELQGLSEQDINKIITSI